MLFACIAVVVMPGSDDASGSAAGTGSADLETGYRSEGDAITGHATGRRCSACNLGCSRQQGAPG